MSGDLLRVWNRCGAPVTLGAGARSPVEVDRRRLPWVLFGGVLLLVLAIALLAPPVIARWDLGSRAGELSAAETAGAISRTRSVIVQGVAPLWFDRGVCGVGFGGARSYRKVVRRSGPLR